MFWVFNLLIFIFFIKLSLYASTTDAQQVTKRQNFKDLKTVCYYISPFLPGENSGRSWLCISGSGSLSGCSKMVTQVQMSDLRAGQASWSLHGVLGSCLMVFHMDSFELLHSKAALRQSDCFPGCCRF